MYTQIKGEILSNKFFNLELMTASGMAVRVLTPIRVTDELESSKATSAHLHLYTVYKEDNIILYGFLSREDRDLFELVVNTVDGVGPKMALAVLNRFSPAEFLDVISTANLGQLSKCPGIGPKTAEKIMFTFKDKTLRLAKLVGTTSSKPASKNEDEAIQALVVLGVGEAAAKKKIADLVKTNPAATVESLVRDALKP